MKKYLTQYIALFVGTLLVQIPATVNAFVYDPHKVRIYYLDTFSITVFLFLLIYLYNHAMIKGIKFFIVVATLTIFLGPITVFVIGLPIRLLILKEQFEWIDFSFFILVTRSYFVFYLYLTCIYLITHYWTEYKIQKENALKATLLANEAQLKMLQYQINPHFLFNSLNAIQAMIEKDKDRAKEMIAELSDFFRYTLSRKNQVFISLGEEIDALQKYLSIQKERFGERLQVHFEIDTNSFDANIPAFLIHPLVENSVKYGFSADNHNLELLIKSETNNGRLTIEVKNSGVLRTAEQLKDASVSSTKTGIENIKKRLELLYPGNYEFELKEKDNWVTAKITIRHFK